MSIAKDITEYISDNTIFEVGVDLFLGFLPIDKDVGVAIAEVGGSENDTNMQRTQLHIVSIADDYTTADANCYIVYNQLVYSYGFIIDSGYVFNVIPINTPTYIGLNEHEKVIMTCRVALFKEKQ
jgi:hypothetical protein